MPLHGIVQPAPSGVLGFDTNTVLSLEKAAAFAAAGYKFCIRYVGRTNGQAANDLSPLEAQHLLDAGLAIMAVQHPRKTPWIPAAGWGVSDGQAAIARAQAIGFPAGVNLWCDLEGVKAGTPAQVAADYANGWFDTVTASGFVPGLYVGAAAILNAAGLAGLEFKHFWKSASIVPDVPGRGYQIVQSKTQTINELRIDQNRTQRDQAGGQALWLAPAA